MDLTKIPRLTIPENIKPYLPLLVGLLPETVTVKGKAIQFRTTLLKALSDGDLDTEDLLAFVLAYAGAPNAPVILPPNVQPIPVPPAPTAPVGGTSSPGLLSWIEECWHDWFKNDPLTTHPGEDSDWAEQGSPIHNQIVTGKRNLPPGGRARFMAEVAPAGSKLHPGIITHNFLVDGSLYQIRSDSGEPHQPFGDLAHVVRGDRWRAGEGWDVTIQFRAFSGPHPKTLTYWVTGEGGRESAPVSIKLAHV